MPRLRSVTFNLYWAAWTALFLVPLVVLALCGSPERPIRAATRLWARGILYGLRRIVGLTYVEEGREHIPSEPCLIVANHQSAWETLAFLVLIPDVAIVAKRELVAIPVVGWFLKRSPMIIIDRANGSQALRTMIDQSREAIAQGRSVLMFPEGTRGEIGEPVQFKRGVELLYARLGLPVLPVAVNSGLYWPSGGAKRPGKVIVRYLDALAPGLSSAGFMSATQDAIDRELDRWRVAPRIRPVADVGLPTS
ncbi:acyl-phosphate glycerol 3-phosphate acyltransferase [Methylobacterium sp. Leaf399]|uniref:lysophospholipid acyltransferase family protein n=1 Tax=unclassified Methylobacterium TaxID=2615210 RepID=UPI0006F99BEB|nr:MULTISPECIES: lysophospholipid acyltransferase family protein [unclassified Methylobacterium]KQP54166.1 acyl-phosphate glycerol 3-phosphate acyltransferase [Methylobacterium sp. Leaf108]KQT14510.1 acyl-phosphate glycerol 3-phosphate acyltransferase [Methylobacterium sp. Leaf399]KQT78837.1 acyl-phosphate glycerol 3-phosphate acyltransferase [Methylobacterium sp. Leaf466]